MTVKELRQQLEQFDDDDIVIVSSDEEGNSYHPLYALEDRYYIAEDQELAYSEDDFEEDEEYSNSDSYDSYEDYLTTYGAVKACVLFP